MNGAESPFPDAFMAWIWTNLYLPQLLSVVEDDAYASVAMRMSVK